MSRGTLIAGASGLIAAVIGGVVTAEVAHDRSSTRTELALIRERLKYEETVIPPDRNPSDENAGGEATPAPSATPSPTPAPTPTPTPAPSSSDGSSPGGGGGGGVAPGGGSPRGGSGGGGGGKTPKPAINETCVEKYGCPPTAFCAGMGSSPVTFCHNSTDSFGNPGLAVSAVCMYSGFENGGSASYFISRFGRFAFGKICYGPDEFDNDKNGKRFKQTETPQR